MKIRIVFISLFSALLLFSSLITAQQSTYVDPQLHQYPEDIPFSCLLVMSDQVNTDVAQFFPDKSQKGAFVFQQLKTKATQSQKDIIAYLSSKNIPYRTFFLVNSIEIQCTYEALNYLSDRKDVSMILSIPNIGLELPQIDRNQFRLNSSLPTWGIQMIKANIAWSKGIRGEGVTIGGQDTGYDWEHPALKQQYKGDSLNHNYTWHDAIHTNASTNPCGTDVTFPCDDGSHGTHTMGTMVGGDPDGIQIGVSPASEWIGCRNMDMGYGTPVTYLECFEWFLAPTDLNNQNPDPSRAPDVINNSWACPPFEGCNNGNFHVMRMAVENLKNAGVFVVASAGNSGPFCESISAPPAIFEESFVIGASNEIDEMASFSSRGPVTIDSSFRQKPDVVAPGVNTISCVPDSGYASYSGTSMAGPHVAGAVALLISASPDLRGQVDSIAWILKMTADTLYLNDTCASVPSSSIPNYTFGYGRINLEKALRWVRPDLFVATSSIQRSFSVNVFPNPTTDLIQVQFSQLIDYCSLELHDVMGRLIMEKSFRSIEHTDLNFATLTKGIYFLTIRSFDASIVHKISKL